MIDIEIDKLTNSVEEVATGRKFDTRVERATRADLVGSDINWRFDWLKEIQVGEVYKLVVPELGDAIHGLISLARRPDHVFVNLVENHPANVGSAKRIEGVAGNLFAFAAKLSNELGHSGFVSFVAKTKLVQHYEERFGAQRVGRSCRLYLDTAAAMKLIRTYFGDE